MSVDKQKAKPQTAGAEGNHILIDNLKDASSPPAGLQPCRLHVDLRYVAFTMHVAPGALWLPKPEADCLLDSFLGSCCSS